LTFAGLESLRRSGDFARVRGRGRRTQTSALAIYSLMKRSGPVRVGIVVGRSVGGAVERNRVRRRLRAALAGLLGPTPRDLVIVARPASARTSFAELSKELAGAL
jgi:ribonuclease P protein component